MSRRPLQESSVYRMFHAAEPISGLRLKNQFDPRLGKRRFLNDRRVALRNP